MIEPCFFLKLPLEIRIMIYTFLFFGNNCDTFVCCWAPLTIPSLTCNILSSDISDRSSWKPVDTTIFSVSKVISEEARSLFYNRGIFRFNSIQITALLLLPQILDYLTEVQIEDTLPNHRLWKLDLMLCQLSARPSLKRIIVGGNAAGDSVDETYDIGSRYMYGLIDKGTEIHKQMLLSGDEKYGDWASQHEESRAVVIACVKHRIEYEIPRTARFFLASKPDLHVLELLAYPKVKFINFRKKFESVKSLDVHASHSEVERSSKSE